MGVKLRRFHKTPTTSSRSPGKLAVSGQTRREAVYLVWPATDSVGCAGCCGKTITLMRGTGAVVAGLRTDTARHLAFNAPETYVLLPHRLYICFSLHVFLYTSICIYVCTHMVVLMSFYPWSLYIPTFLRMSYGRYTRILLTPSKQAKLDEDKTAAH